MKKAARAARVPVFFLQAENDFDTTPSRVLDNEMRRAGRPSRMQIFPRAARPPWMATASVAAAKSPPGVPPSSRFSASRCPRTERRLVDYSDSSFEKRKLQWVAPPARVWVRSRRMPRVA